MNRTEIQELKNRRLFAKRRHAMPPGEGLIFWATALLAGLALYLIVFFIFGAF